jgi:hypothetical protein
LRFGRHYRRRQDRRSAIEDVLGLLLGFFLCLDVTLQILQHRLFCRLALNTFGIQIFPLNLVDDDVSALVGLWLSFLQRSHRLFVPGLVAVLLNLDQFLQRGVGVITEAVSADADVDHAHGVELRQSRLDGSRAGALRCLSGRRGLASWESRRRSL